MTNHKICRPTFSLASSGSHGSTFTARDEGFGKKYPQRRRVSLENDCDPSDGNASLTYSATSSVNSSGSSAAGESSTDSSFADIMRVLDTEETQGLKHIMRREGMSSKDELRTRTRRSTSSGQSVASSLVYSVDGVSQMDEINHFQTPSSQTEKNQPFNTGLKFAPAGRLSKKKRDKNLSDATPSIGAFPRTSPTKSTPQAKLDFCSYRDSSPTPSEDTPTKSPPSEKSTPPMHPKKTQKYHVEDAEKDDEIWYAKWWMFCFPDAAKDLMPKR